MTVGYQGRDASELINALFDAGVDVLVDVRLTPLSRKPGLSKTRLAEALRERGIEYLHLPQLGNPRDNRDAYRNADAAAVARFREVLSSPGGAGAVKYLRDLAERSVIALMCFERDHGQCHRNQVVEAITATDSAEICVTHL